MSHFILISYNAEVYTEVHFNSRQELMHYVLKLRLKHEATDLKGLDQRGKNLHTFYGM